MPIKENNFWIVVVANFLQRRFETYCPYYDATGVECIGRELIENFKRAYTAGYRREPFNIYNFEVMPVQVVTENSNE